MKKIQELAFVKTELELFLDTHPDCKVALENYTDTVDALVKAREQYAASYGPVGAHECRESWSWVEGSWPWDADFPGAASVGRKGGKG